jgi:phosphoserine phosphatase RsbU/P
MQISLMPTEDPDMPGFDISGCCVPARNVGGDHFDYVRFGGDRKRLGIAVVDVAGKGMDAALTAVFTSGAFVSEAQHETDIAKILAKMNTAIRSRNNRSRFVSFLLAAVDPDAGTLSHANAGQSRPMLFRGGSVSVLTNEGAHFPLGLVDDVTYTISTTPLLPGETVLLYTDGLSEAMNAAKEVFGEERLKSLFASLCTDGATSQTIVTGLKDGIFAYAGAADQHDDVTIVVVKTRRIDD